MFSHWRCGLALGDQIGKNESVLVGGFHHPNFCLSGIAADDHGRVTVQTQLAISIDNEALMTIIGVLREELDRSLIVRVRIEGLVEAAGDVNEAVLKLEGHSLGLASELKELFHTVIVLSVRSVQADGFARMREQLRADASTGNLGHR